MGLGRHQELWYRQRRQQARLEPDVHWFRPSCTRGRYDQLARTCSIPCRLSSMDLHSARCSRARYVPMIISFLFAHGLRGVNLQACRKHSTSSPELGNHERNGLARRTCSRWQGVEILRSHHGNLRRSHREVGLPRRGLRQLVNRGLGKNAVREISPESKYTAILITYVQE